MTVGGLEEAKRGRENRRFVSGVVRAATDVRIGFFSIACIYAILVFFFFSPLGGKQEIKNIVTTVVTITHFMDQRQEDIPFSFLVL